MSTVEHLRPHKRVNTAAWLAEAAEAAKEASAVVVLAMYEDESTQSMRFSFCNLNEQQLTWVGALFNDFITARRLGME